MIQKALEYLVRLGKQEQILEVNGQKYSPVSLNLIHLPKVESIMVNSLTGLIDYIKSDFDKKSLRGTLIHVVSHDKVQLISNILADTGRETYIDAEAFKPKFSFGQWYDVENFNIALQSCFVGNPDLTQILKVVGNVKEESVRQTSDDGISQAIIAKTGIAQVEEVIVPNPVILAPYRTFVEIQQPESKFVFRMQQGPKCALFEADGGAWRIEAMQSIKTYLEEELTGIDIKVIS